MERTRTMLPMLSMVMLVVLSTISLGGVKSGTTNVEISGNERRDVQALYAAEGGVSRIVGEYLNPGSHYANGDSPATIGTPITKPVIRFH